MTVTKSARSSRRRPASPAAVRTTVPVRNTTALLYRRSPWIFLAFSTAVLVAFWPSYFSRLSQQPTFHAHTHGLAMTAWCALLIAQGWLVRGGHRALHRNLGLLSYALVPAIAVATLAFVHFRMQGAAPPGRVELYFLALMINAVVAFVAIYALAMYHRRVPATHARYMICTIFPLFTPVTDRIIGRHVPSIVPLVPRIDGVPVVPFAGFLLADAILVALWIWDWRWGRQSNAFPVALGILVLYHVSVLTFHRLPAWRAFGEWFVGG
jgi:uncharacterized membrane protein